MKVKLIYIGVVKYFILIHDICTSKLLPSLRSLASPCCSWSHTSFPLLFTLLWVEVEPITEIMVVLKQVDEW